MPHLAEDRVAMKLLYVGDLSEYGGCLLRLQALRRLGFEVAPLDSAPYVMAGGPIRYRLRLRLLIGREVARFNRDLLTLCDQVRPDFIWLDKPLFLWPETASALRRSGAVVINYITDNPFGLLWEPWFRLIRRIISVCDVNVVPRPVSVADFTAAGAERMVLMPFAFDPINQFPDPGRPVSVPLSFVGSPWDQRPRFLTELAGTGLPVLIRGERWRRTLPWGSAGVTLGPPAWGPDYRRALQEAAINLSFVTHHNRDPSAHKSFEITACGGFLLAERTQAHRELFEEGREAEFFASVGEAADKIRFYLANPARREAVARAGCRRAWSSGYSYDERLAVAFAAIDPRLGPSLTARAQAFIDRRRLQLGLD